MTKPSRIPKELKRFVAAMLLIMASMAVVAVIVDLSVNQ
jgi:hypothetical protein